jgi:hypothetical protein
MLKIMCGPERFQVVFLEHEFTCLVNNIYHVRVMLGAICWAIVVLEINTCTNEEVP